MKRSKWKGPVLIKTESPNSKKNKKSNLYIWSRNAVVLPSFVGKSVFVYNGRQFGRLNVIQEMLGHKFGEFVQTRTRHIFKKKGKI
jgi:small subunit ribosomal protein S19